MNTNMQSVAGDRFRLAPLLLFANSLLLRSEYKRHLNAICIDVIMLEAITQRNGEWGRYVLCVEREFVTAIRAMFFEICHEDSIEGFLVDLHMIIRTFVNGAPSSSRTIDYMWQKAAVPAHAFYEVCCIEDEESFLRALLEFAEPSEQAKEIAASTESSGSVITIAGVVQGQFPLWDSETFPSWYYSLDSPYMQRYSNGYCYKRLSTSIIRHDYGKWPKISDVRRSQYNPYMRCSFVGGKKWHVPSPTSAWVPALRCAKDLESSACVGGDAHIVLDVAATLSPPPSIAEVGGMSATIAKLYNLSLEGFSAVTVSPSPWSESVAPYTPYLFGFPFHRRGYLIYPVGLAPIASRVSANVAFVKRPVAAYASVSGKWYSLDVSEPRLSFSCTSSELVLVMVLFPGVFDYGDVADFLAADVQRGILSKL